MKRMKRIADVALGATILLGSGLAAAPARAGYIVTLMQVGSNVIAKGHGTIDLSGLSFSFSGSTLAAAILPFFADIATGPAGFNPADVYTGFIGPTSFGAGAGALASSGSGNFVALENPSTGIPLLFVPPGYVSGSPLTDSSTYDNASFVSLGVTPGTYVWRWGSGVHADSFTLDVKTASVPEPSGLLVFALPLGFVMLLAARRRRAARNPGSA